MKEYTFKINGKIYQGAPIVIIEEMQQDSLFGGTDGLLNYMRGFVNRYYTSYGIELPFDSPEEFCDALDDIYGVKADEQ